jgi:hypothetical protein
MNLVVLPQAADEFEDAAAHYKDPTECGLPAAVLRVSLRLCLWFGLFA